MILLKHSSWLQNIMVVSWSKFDHRILILIWSTGLMNIFLFWFNQFLCYNIPPSSHHVINFYYNKDSTIFFLSNLHYFLIHIQNISFDQKFMNQFLAFLWSSTTLFQICLYIWSVVDIKSHYITICIENLKQN